MRRSILAALFVPPAALLCLAIAPTPAAVPCDNIFPHEPVLLYEISGNSLCCMIDVQLTVFGDGSARIASAEGTNGRSRINYVSQTEVQTLLSDLGALGAGVACDVPSFFSDVPLATLTLMRGTTEGRTRTWSWLGDDGHNGAIQARLDLFVQQTFPGF